MRGICSGVNEKPWESHTCGVILGIGLGDYELLGNDFYGNGRTSSLGRGLDVDGNPYLPWYSFNMG